MPATYAIKATYEAIMRSIMQNIALATTLALMGCSDAAHEPIDETSEETGNKSQECLLPFALFAPFAGKGGMGLGGVTLGMAPSGMQPNGTSSWGTYGANAVVGPTASTGMDGRPSKGAVPAPGGLPAVAPAGAGPGHQGAPAEGLGPAEGALPGSRGQGGRPGPGAGPLGTTARPGPEGDGEDSGPDPLGPPGNHELPPRGGGPGRDEAPPQGGRPAGVGGVDPPPSDMGFQGGSSAAGGDPSTRPSGTRPPRGGARPEPSSRPGPDADDGDEESLGPGR